MDNQLVFDVFSNAIKAASLLNIDKPFADTLQSKLKRLPPMQIGRFGQLQEWMNDWDRPEDKHRHISHLYGLFPSNQISPYGNPQLFEAAKTSLVHRGDISTGWSMGWKVNWWARLLDGNRAYKLISNQLSPAPKEKEEQHGGTYPNLFDAHPPFQIDGNFGCTSGIAEMLVQSQDGAIQILPALPDAWPNGTVKGLVTRGGFVVNISWKNGKIDVFTITSKLGGNCRFRLYDEIKASNGVKLVKAKGENPNPFFAIARVKEPLSVKKSINPAPALRPTYVYDFATQPGGVYTFTRK
jgi:alpha-L-fucosidase 2